jgi:hypothetical protein
VADQDVSDQGVVDRTDRRVEMAPPTPRMRSRAVASATRARRRRRWATAVAIVVSFVAGVAVGSGLTEGTATGLAVASGVAEPDPPTSSVVPPSRSPSGGPGDRSFTVRTPAGARDRPASDPGTASSSASAQPRRAPVQATTTSASDRLRVPASPGPHDLVTPSGNIVCAYAAGVLDCQIGTGLVPVPDAACPADGGAWAGVSLPSTGDAEPRCTPTSIEDRVAPDRVLAYGERWERDGIGCTSGRDGLRCENADGGELFLSRDRAAYGRSTATP